MLQALCSGIVSILRIRCSSLSVLAANKWRLVEKGKYFFLFFQKIQTPPRADYRISEPTGERPLEQHTPCRMGTKYIIDINIVVSRDDQGHIFRTLERPSHALDATPLHFPPKRREYYCHTATVRNNIIFSKNISPQTIKTDFTHLQYRHKVPAT